jgi:hypothetical protein
MPWLLILRAVSCSCSFLYRAISTICAWSIWCSSQLRLPVQPLLGGKSYEGRKGNKAGSSTDDGLAIGFPHVQELCSFFARRDTTSFHLGSAIAVAAVMTGFAGVAALAAGFLVGAAAAVE